ncbi:MAG TPA: hypothetical protein ENK79_01145 [Campylobacterales bacterium]|nr:hypothetical protein [Campylobacterales bacterium]
MPNRQFYIFIFLYTIALFYLAIELPIGPNEAKVFYTDTKLLHYATHLCSDFFGNGLDFRLPFLIFGLLNIYLFFVMSKIYFKQDSQSYLATTIFALLPGIITASVIVNIAVFVITLVLGFIILHANRQIVGEGVVMLLLLFVHDASVIFFISLSIYFAFKRDSKLFGISILLTAISLLYFNGLDIGGKPKGKFLELLGLYVALFSPLVFIYFFYALYRIWLREKKDILWYISFTAFVLSILLSLRQQVIMTDFAPYVIVAVVLMVVVYNKTLLVRLPQFQKGYRLGYKIVMGSLIFSSLIIIFHKPLFYLLKDKTEHFAYPFYKPYWIKLELSNIGQNCYTAKRKKIQYQLKYYGINECKDTDVPKIHN